MITTSDANTPMSLLQTKADGAMELFSRFQEGLDNPFNVRKPSSLSLLSRLLHRQLCRRDRFRLDCRSIWPQEMRSHRSSSSCPCFADQTFAWKTPLHQRFTNVFPPEMERLLCCLLDLARRVVKSQCQVAFNFASCESLLPSAGG